MMSKGEKQEGLKHKDTSLQETKLQYLLTGHDTTCPFFFLLFFLAFVLAVLIVWSYNLFQ